MLVKSDRNSGSNSLASSDLFKPPYVAIKKHTQTFFQLGDNTLLQSARGTVDFGRHLALCTIEAHRKGRWVIHLQTRLLPRSNTQSMHLDGKYTHTLFYSVLFLPFLSVCFTDRLLLLPELLLVQLQQTEAGGDTPTLHYTLTSVIVQSLRKYPTQPTWFKSF